MYLLRVGNSKKRPDLDLTDIVFNLSFFANYNTTYIATICIDHTMESWNGI